MNVTVETRERFLREYGHIRQAEGRGSESSEYYRALPFRDLSGRNNAMWAMRATTYRWFLHKVLVPMEVSEQRPLDIADLGAGNCWLSHQLCLRGHVPVAVDIFSDENDGLGAAKHYPISFPVIERDFDELPFGANRFDLAVFNASLHYSTDYLHTFTEIRRCLRKSGAVVVLDSPIYRSPEHGALMVAEKRAEFVKRYGFPSDALPSREFLDRPTLTLLSEKLGLEWHIVKPWYGWRWHLRPFNAWIHRRRPPSRFWILVGRFRNS
jgi:SAM-dependent methyltransferase